LLSVDILMDYFVGGAMLVGGTTSAVGWGMAIGRAGLPPAHALVAWAVVAAPILLATARYSFSPASEAALALTTATLCLWWVPMRVACALTGYGPGGDCLASAYADGVETGGGARLSAAAADVDAPAAADPALSKLWAARAHTAHRGAPCTPARTAALLLLPVAYATPASLAAGVPLTSPTAAAATTAAAIATLIVGAEAAPPLLRHVPDGVAARVAALAAHCALALLAAATVTGVASAAASAAGLAVHPPFGAPWAPASLADFWAARWNRPAAQLLRHGVYEPVRDGVRWVAAARRAERRGRRRRGGWAAADATAAAVGVVATFLVSGVAHEAVLRAAAAGTAGSGVSRGEWVLFFVAQGAAVVAEKAVVAVGLWPTAPAVRMGLALAFLGVTAEAWFFPVVVRTGVRERGLADLTRVFRWWERRSAGAGR